MNPVLEALKVSWKIVFSSCVMCDKRTCPLGEHIENPCPDCHIGKSTIKSNEALTLLRSGKLVVVNGERLVEFIECAALDIERRHERDGVVKGCPHCIADNWNCSNQNTCPESLRAYLTEQEE